MPWTNTRAETIRLVEVPRKENMPAFKQNQLWYRGKDGVDWSGLLPYYDEDILFKDSIQEIRGMADFAAMNEVYARHFGDHRPARAAVAVRTLPKNVGVEIEAIARLP